MSLHWKSLDTAGKISAIAGIYEPGMSASHIAANFNGATRNAVIGLYHRHADKLDQWPLRDHGGYSADRPRKAREAKSPTIRRSGITGLFMGVATPKATETGDTAPKPLPTPRTVPHEAKLCGKPMMMLKAMECRWAVNNAEPGETHLFCGLPAEGSYCAHHKSRSFMPPRAIRTPDNPATQAGDKP